MKDWNENPLSRNGNVSSYFKLQFKFLAKRYETMLDCQTMILIGKRPPLNNVVSDVAFLWKYICNSLR